MNTQLVLVHALSPIHCGTGQALGGIDLPIARERPTNVPLVPGSSLKGVLRSRGRRDDRLHLAVFGPETENASEYAGSVQFSDLLLAFLPVRSVRGTVAWTTSPYLLRRLARSLAESGVKLGDVPAGPANVGTARVALKSPLCTASKRVVFEDLDFGYEEDKLVTSFAQRFAEKAMDEPERAYFSERVCVVHDDVMSMLLVSAMELQARNRLNPDTKTVAKGALWTEESLPVESVLAGIAVATPTAKAGEAPLAPEKLFGHVLSLCANKAIQLGGKASVGRGLCRVKLIAGGA